MPIHIHFRSRLLLGILLTLFAPLFLGAEGTEAVAADEVTISLSAPSVVEAGIQFRVRYTVSSSDATGFSPSDFKGFEVIYGPSTSRSSNFSIVNGKTTSSSTITYTYVLVASKAGDYTLSPATAQVDGKTIRSSSQAIKVLPAGQQPSAAQQQQNAASNNRSSQQGKQQSQSSSNSISSSDLFMTATASRTTVYKQEAILLTYKLYTLVDITQLDGKLPTLDGFQIQEIDLPRSKEFTLEQYKGKNYHSVVWAQYVLFPQKSGDLTIPAISYEGVVRQRNRNIDPIDAFFNGVTGIIELKKTITAPQVTIHVKDLPTPPEGFSGAVGQFSLASSLTPQQVRENEAVTLKVSVKGTGNMKLMETPVVEWPKDFETYDAKATDNFSLTASGLSGTKTFEYLAVPRHAGKYEIPVPSFIYFDPTAKAYKTLTASTYTLDVAKGSGGSSGGVANYTNNQQDVAEVGQDIRYIHTKPLAAARSGFALTRWSYLLLYLVPLFLFFLAVLLARKHIAARADIRSTRATRANKAARKRLKAAAKLLAQHNANAFYDEVLRALNGYLSDKFAIPQSELNKETLASVLSQKGVSQELTDQLFATLNDCEVARYAPGDPQQSMDNTYKAAINLITRLEA